MDNMHYSEITSTLSDSGYSNSCSNSQDGSTNSVTPPPEIFSKEKQRDIETVIIHEEKTTMAAAQTKEQETVKQCIGDASLPGSQQLQFPIENIVIRSTDRSDDKDGFSCVISSTQGGVLVCNTSNSITKTLGFPKDMWNGRSFIDFVHPMDRNTFASQLGNGVTTMKNVNGNDTLTTMACRIRRYRGLSSGFGVKNQQVSFMPFLLKIFFRKYICDKEGDVIYFLIQATPLFSVYKVPNEILLNPVPFIIRHAANGIIQYIDPTSMPYLGYLPQDAINKDALDLYHPHDLVYLRKVYETIVQEGGVSRSIPYRMLAQNGDYVKLETEWFSLVNSASKKLEFIVGKHFVIEGPCSPDVFKCDEKGVTFSTNDKKRAQSLREAIIMVMNKTLKKSMEAGKLQKVKRGQNLASYVESLMEDSRNDDDEICLSIKHREDAYRYNTCFEFLVPRHDSIMLGGMAPPNRNDSMFITKSQMRFNQLNCNETLQRYFNSHVPYFVNGNLEAADKNEARTIRKCSPGQSLTTTCPVPLANYSRIQLTNFALNKHNRIMELQLMQKIREIKLVRKGDREVSSKKSSLKNEEHLARCNASFLPTLQPDEHYN